MPVNIGSSGYNSKVTGTGSNKRTGSTGSAGSSGSAGSAQRGSAVGSFGSVGGAVSAGSCGAVGSAQRGSACGSIDGPWGNRKLTMEGLIRWGDVGDYYVETFKENNKTCQRVHIKIDENTISALTYDCIEYPPDPYPNV